VCVFVLLSEASKAAIEDDYFNWVLLSLSRLSALRR